MVFKSEVVVAAEIEFGRLNHVKQNLLTRKLRCAFHIHLGTISANLNDSVLTVNGRAQTIQSILYDL